MRYVPIHVPNFYGYRVLGEQCAFELDPERQQKKAAFWREHFFPIEIHIHPSGYAQVVVVYGRTGDYLRTASSILTFDSTNPSMLGANHISSVKRMELGFVGILPAEEES